MKKTKERKRFRRWMAGFLAFILLLGSLPGETFFAQEVTPLDGVEKRTGEKQGTVYVSVRNDRYPADEGAAWDGALFEEEENGFYPVEIVEGETDTIMGATEKAFEECGIESVGIESNYISDINGLSEFDGGDQSGWMITKNDWFISQGAANFSVADGDIVEWMYTCKGYGGDIGGSWEDDTTLLKDLQFSAGTLDREFRWQDYFSYGGSEEDIAAQDFVKIAENGGLTEKKNADFEYTLTIPSDVSSIRVTPTAMNKNFQTRVYKNTTVDWENTAIQKEENYETILSGLAPWEDEAAFATGYYSRFSEIPVKDGDTLTVACGLSYWNSMNSQSGGTSSEKAGHIYTINIKKEKEPVEENGTYEVEIKVGLSENTIKLYKDEQHEQPILLRAGQADDNYRIYEANLNEGTYYYEGFDGEGKSLGGMSFELPITAGADGSAPTQEKQIVVLRRVNYAATTKINGYYPTEEQYHVEVSGLAGDEVTVGTPYTDSTGKTVYPVLQYAVGNAKLYNCFFIPEQEITDAYGYGTGMLINRTVAVGYTATAVNGTFPTLIDAAITAPEGALVQVFWQYNNFNAKEQACERVEAGDNGTKIHHFLLPKSNGNCTYRVSQEGKLTEAGYLDLSGAEKAAVTVAFSETESPQSRPDYRGEDSGNYAAALAKRMEDSILLNLNEANTLCLSEQEEKRVRAYRGAWEIVNSDTANIMIEPDFHYQILSGEDIVSLSPKSAGNARDNWADLKAERSGTAIVEVTYDAIGISGKTSYTGTYGAIDPERTGVFVVQAGIPDAEVSMGIEWDAEFDTVYFDGEQGSLSIQPVSPQGDVTKVTVQTAGNGSLGAVEEVTGKSGVYDIPIRPGNNIVAMHVGNHVTYQVVRGGKVTYTITNHTTGRTNREEDFSVKQGDSVSVSFNGLHMPVPKMSGIYNPGYGGTMKCSYTLEDGSVLSSKGTQYDFISNHTITFTAYEKGVYRLTNGYIPMSSMGSAFGAHRAIGDGGVGTNFNAFEVRGEYCVLPDLSFEVQENPDMEVDTDNFTALKSLKLFYGTSAFNSGFSFTDVQSNKALCYSKPQSAMSDYALNVMAVPQEYGVDMELCYWYEGDKEKTVIPLTSGKTMTSEPGILQSDRILNMEISVQPKNPAYGKKRIYSKIVYPCTFSGNTQQNMTYVHPILSSLTIQDVSGNTIPLQSKYGDGILYYTLSDYYMTLPEHTDNITIKVKEVVKSTSVTADKNDILSVFDADGNEIFFTGEEKPGAEMEASLRIGDMNDLTIRVKSYADETTRDYHILFAGNSSLSGLFVTAGTLAESTAYAVLQEFSPDEKDYTVIVPDERTAFGVWILKDPSVKEIQAYAEWTTTSGKAEKKEITPDAERGVLLSDFLKAGGADNTCHITVNAVTTSGKTLKETYTLHAIRKRTLGNLTVKSSNGSAVTLAEDMDGLRYSGELLADEAYVKVDAVPYSTAEGCYQVFVDGKKAENGQSVKVEVPLSINRIPVTVSHLDGISVPTDYEILLSKSLPSSGFRVRTVPEDAIVFVRSQQGKGIYPDENGMYHFEEGKKVTIHVTKKGYIGKSTSVTVGESGNYSFTLQKAAENAEINADMDSYWPDFRGNKDNNAVRDVSVPTDAENAELYWAAKYGDGWDSGALSSPILVDGYLIATSSTSIVKMDCTSGEIVAHGTMATTSAFNITPPTYAEGMIFVALKDGTVQAFNAETLESLWIYHDPLKGQPNSPITYHNGYVYTGFWQGESKEANWVCLSATDEAIDQDTEEKVAAWTYTRLGGFYWAGAYVTDEFLVVGTDDGHTGCTSQTSSVVTLNPLTGEIIDEMTGFDADIRCSIAYDEETDRYYFDSKGGSFYSVKIHEDGTFEKDSLKSLDIGGMSTSTPVIYNGRAYIGVSGSGQFVAYSGHRIAVIDLSSFTVAYTAKTQGYPQTSGLLTTAYEEETGYVYLYFIDNYTPGKVRVIKDRKGQTVMEEDDSITYAPILFTPSGKQAQYAICSPIVDEYGTLYFKNDSAHMMAVGSKVTGLNVTRKPRKTTYTEGDTFDADGITVVADLANGKKKDVTSYVNYTGGEKMNPLTSEITVTFPYVMYQDRFKDTSAEKTDLLRDANEAGVELKKPVTYVPIEVLPLNGEASKLQIRTPESYVYTGEKIMPQLFVKYDGKVLRNGIDYNISYRNNVNVNCAQVKGNGMGDDFNKKLPTILIKGKGAYQSVIKSTAVNFTIYEKSLDADEIKTVAADPVENGRNRKPQAELFYGKYPLKKNRDYRVKGYCTEEDYRKNKDSYEELQKCLTDSVKESGNYRILLEGCRNYSGLLAASFTIREKGTYQKLEKCKVKKLPAKLYTGEAIALSSDEIIVTKGKETVSSENYTVVYCRNTDAGKGTLILLGKGDYTGKKKVSFRITQKNITDESIRIEPVTDVFYSGQNVTPKLSIYDTGCTDVYGEPRLLTEGKDYSLSYQNNKKAALKDAKKAPRIIIKGKGNYKGKRDVTFRILKE